MIRLELWDNGIEEEINRLADGPTAADLMQFETVLAKQFDATKRRVHKITHSLMLSGKVSSDISDNKWEGTISYGGSSTGINNPVEYAEYEREREGHHDFLAPAIEMGDDYISALNSFLGG